MSDKIETLFDPIPALTNLQDRVEELEKDNVQLKGLTKALLETVGDINIMIKELKK